MSNEPIVLSSDALTRLKEEIVSGNSGSGSDSSVSGAVETLHSTVSSSQTSINQMRNDIATLKSSITTINAQINAICSILESTEADVSQVKDIVVAEPDAPSAESGDSDAPVYRVETGVLNSDLFYADNTATCKHYTYDNLHVIIINATAKNIATSETWYDIATFSDLSSFTGHGYIAPIVGNKISDGFRASQWVFRIEGNKIKAIPRSNASVFAGTIPVYHKFFWFDRSAQSKLFSFDDGQLTSSTVSINAPNYAVHARLGNLHFLSISTQMITALGSAASANICSFANNLAIPCGAHMGFGVCVPTSQARTKFVNVAAPSNNSIQIQTQGITQGALDNGYGVTQNDYLSINTMWIDANGVIGDAEVEAGTTAYDSNDAYARRFKLGRLNVVQVYGSRSQPSNVSSHIALFSSQLTNPYQTSIIKDITVANYTLAETYSYKTSALSKAKTTTITDNVVNQPHEMDANMNDDNTGVNLEADDNRVDYPNGSEYDTYSRKTSFSVVSRVITNHTTLGNHQILWFGSE